MCPCNRECRTTTTAQMAGTLPLQLLLEDLLVGANRCASQADPDPAASVPRALSHAKRDVVCSRHMLYRLARCSAGRSARATSMLTVSACKTFCCPVMRGLAPYSSRSSVPRSDPAIVYRV